jgi:cob(I)alamin adenosyltransferase
MVKLTKIYTKTGDKGQTSLADMTRVSKTNSRIEAYATVDEANSHIGLVLDSTVFDEYAQSLLTQIQNELFEVGTDIANGSLKVTEAMITNLESEIDEYNANLEPLTAFILPGGGQTASRLHIARTVVRRAERATWLAIEDNEGMSILPAQYLNRLSDLLFVMARTYAVEERLWLPAKEQHPPKRFRDIGNAE